MYKVKNLIIILGIALIGCKSEDGRPSLVMEKHDKPISVYAKDITRMVKPHSRALVSIDRDVIASDINVLVKLLNVEPITRNQDCQITKVDDTQFEIETNNPTACSFKYTVSTEQSQTPVTVSAYSRVLVQEETATNSASLGSFTLPPKSIVMEAQSCSTISLQDVIPNGANLQSNIDVIGSGVVNSFNSPMNTLNYCVQEAGYNRLFYSAYDSNANQYYIGTVLVGVSGEGNQPPEVGSFSYYYDPGNMIRAVPAYEEIMIDVSDFVSDPDGDPLQIIDVQSTNASVSLPFDSEKLDTIDFYNKKIKFLAKVPGQYYINYMVSDHNGGYGVGVINIRVSSPIKDYYYDTGDVRSSFTLSGPLVQSISDKYGFNYQTTQTIDGFVSEPLNIALFDAKTAGAYCKAKGGRLPEKSEIALITNNKENQLASKAKWPQGLSYWVESLSSGELSVYNDTNPSDASVALVASVACLNLNLLDFKIRDPKYIVIDTFRDFVVRYTNSTGEQSIYTRALQWHSSDPSILSIDRLTGRAIGKSKGIVTVTATTSDGKLTDKIDVEVIDELVIVGMGTGSNGYNLAVEFGSRGRVNPVNAVFKSRNNFGDDGIVKLRATLIFEDFGTSDVNLRRALERDHPPAVVHIGYPYSPGSVTVNLLRDFLFDGGVIIYFTEGVTSTRNLFRAIFGDSIQVGRFARSGAVHQFEDIDDPIISGPFGDLRKEYWGQDRSATDYVYNLPKNSYVSLSNAYDWSGMRGATSDEQYKSYSTAIRHKRYKFVWAGDAGFTAFNSSNPTSSIASLTGYPFNVKNYTDNLDDIDADWRPGTKEFGHGVRHNVSNSIMYANAISWLFGSVQSQD
ncbi:Ig-like domain-containing protein [Vibrio metschnikovii]|nr:Ig-like domain-containing protein [Vibrio metschnikovii]